MAMEILSAALLLVLALVALVLAVGLVSAAWVGFWVILTFVRGRY